MWAELTSILMSGRPRLCVITCTGSGSFARAVKSVRNARITRSCGVWTLPGPEALNGVFRCCVFFRSLFLYSFSRAVVLVRSRPTCSLALCHWGAPAKSVSLDVSVGGFGWHRCGELRASCVAGVGGSNGTRSNTQDVVLCL